jgi:drug/metabolite transporter (DMT)-like permease
LNGRSSLCAGDSAVSVKLRVSPAGRRAAFARSKGERAMLIRDMLLAALTSVIWGFGFVIAMFGLDSFSAMQMTALRFLLVGLFIVIVPRPKLPWPSHLLQRYPAAVVAPFALLTPCTGVVASKLIFGEVFSPARYAGMALILCGLAIIVLPLQRMKAL